MENKTCVKKIISSIFLLPFLSYIQTSVGADSGARLQEKQNQWSPYARYGDYLSAQMKSLKKFDYGMFVAKLKAADGPVCTAFWLYSDAPAPGAMPEVAQMWRWNEFDWEFVPYTQATQNSYIALDTGGNPTYYGAKLDMSQMTSGQITADVINWTQNYYITDDTALGMMQRYYNKWMTNGKKDTQINSENYNYLGAIATTGDGYEVGGITGSSKQPGWQNASVWKYPLTAVKPVPSTLDMRKMAAINWWRMPQGNQNIDVTLPGFNRQNYKFIEKLPVLGGSTLAKSYTAAAMNNETYILPDAGNASFNPYAQFNTYTIVWSPTRVAYYINAPDNGTDISHATPVALYTIDDYPSLKASGVQAPQGSLPWVDTGFDNKLGEVSINLANYVAFKAAKDLENSKLTPSQEAGAGWSGNPPDNDWQGVDAYFRSVTYYPLKKDSGQYLDGSNTSDFDMATNVWKFDLGDGSWSKDNFSVKLMDYFGILYAQDFTKKGIEGSDLRDSKSPLAISFIANKEGSYSADKLPLMQLSVTPSTANPKRNFFRVATTMNTGVAISATNPFMFVTVTLASGNGQELKSTNSSFGISGASTPLAFFAPQNGESMTATIKLYTTSTYHGAYPADQIPTAATATAQLTLETSATGDISWEVKSDPKGIIMAYQSVNPHLITVKSPSS
ncbi:hypothetical protein [Cysteiniphilum sp. JM-1]|uniref:hypothetical protein n=1 Tax=Cysteiniphilum sp. JM-1 TaxID=2610891 RepID=UPI0012478941|nr:hypothetical protein [Cysteiniphilum sp. JM-1]